MRASLPDTLRQRRRARASRHPRATPAPAKVDSAEVPTIAELAAVVDSADPAVKRVRDAGGPLDEASYACQCGFLFRAPVSTTVACPHCRAPQAW